MADKKYLVIVESPTKAKTIRKFLPSNYIVEASMGHIRDLPQSASDIPAALKKEEWAKLGVNVDEDFDPLYIVPKDKKKIITDLKSKMKDCATIYLATDEDREGESISWHLLELLKPKVPVKRMVFHEITKTAIQKALKETREVDEKLVRAQETRRILDRLYGYTLSPLIWKKIAYGLSAGRVQSTGLRMIAERERERMRFKRSVYWDIKAQVHPAADKKALFDAKLTSIKGGRVAGGKDFDGLTGKLVDDKKVVLLDEKKSKDLAKNIEKAEWKVTSVEEKTFNSKPAIPFITSTLQMEANRKLGMSSKDTMRTAQRLYEEGLITYMRTDSPNLSQEAINAARNMVVELYGKEYLNPEVRQYAAKQKGAQEAHEAIRPAGAEFTHPDKTGMSGRELALYELIWKRTMATQMKEAEKASMTIKIEAGDAEFSASGTRILFPGFLRVYVEGSDDPEAALEDKEVILPVLKKGDSLKAATITPDMHETKPPARFTEASIVQALEKEGVGRPSTYASIIGTILDRGYVRKEGSALVPTFTGMAVIQLLENHFEHLVDYSFTSEMEESLDKIAYGEEDWLKYLTKFYKGKGGLAKKVEEQDKKIKPEESRTIHIMKDGKPMDIKVGRFGPYVVEKGEGKEEVHASIPEDIAPADLDPEQIKELLKNQANGPTPIGTDPKTKEKIYCLVGRYGAYFQLGEVTEENPKPKRASLPKGKDPKTATIEDAIQALSLPRELGVHPETKKPILANNGRFGPYVMHDGNFRSLKKEDDLFTVDLKRAIELLSEEKGASRRGGKVLKDFGLVAKLKKKVQVLDGKYGPYIKVGTKNITLPEDKRDPKVIEKMTEAELASIVLAAAKK
ncbi:type I DNA topoisomerase [Peredibacter starrii]|uniref:DNA topoisomerase 1 n=1 Tax=Peredibacter starrii TaxID=28202 RepID=A0AAX4HLB9_9BACT|nr:type I DNA topoisomerase [Peredibacter starrii]WPU63991.1 type I DNA topoisomerase [Peredibacter starrii]